MKNERSCLAESETAVKPALVRRCAAPRKSNSLHPSLLDAADELADALDIGARIAARELATAKVLEADVGECDLARLFVVARRGFGLLILDGLVALETRVLDRTATELLGSGDLVQARDPGTDGLLERTDAWRVLTPTRFALLDGDFADRVRPFPQITGSLVRRAQRRTASAGVLRAIASHPALEVRLVLALWHLGERWGRVEPAGIHLCMPLTHRLLGQLVAAERPSISHALKRLEHAGVVTGATNDLHLRRSAETHLELPAERPAGVDEPAAPSASTRRRIA